jgi:hypothetical protein
MKTPLTFLFFLTLVVCHREASAARVFIVDQPENGAGSLRWADLNGAGQGVLWTSPVVSDMRGVAVSSTEGALYFAYCNTSTGSPTEVSIRKGPLRAAEGGYVPTITLALPDGAAGSLVNSVADVECSATHVYFSMPGQKLIQRCQFDGMGLTTVLTHPGAGVSPRDLGPYFFSVDGDTRAYWAVVTTSGDTATQYQRGDLPAVGSIGTQGTVDPIWRLTTPTRTRDIAQDTRDPNNVVLYWCDRQNGAVYAEPAAGGTRRVVLTGLNAPHGLVIDAFAGKGYLADTGKRGAGSQASSHRALRFNLNGSGGIEWLSPASAIAEPWDIAVDLVSASYAEWTTRFFAVIDANQGRDEDPDGDGLTNAAEYAFFTHPLRNDAWKSTAVVEGAVGQFRVTMRSTNDVPVRIEISNDLQTWRWNGDGTGITYTSLTNPISRGPEFDHSSWLTVNLIAPQPRLYVRLRALPPL